MAKLNVVQRLKLYIHDQLYKMGAVKCERCRLNITYLVYSMKNWENPEFRERCYSAVCSDAKWEGITIVLKIEFALWVAYKIFKIIL